MGKQSVISQKRFGIGKGQSCRAEGGLLYRLLFAGKQSEGHGCELEDVWS